MRRRLHSDSIAFFGLLLGFTSPSAGFLLGKSPSCFSSCGAPRGERTRGVMMTAVDNASDGNAKSMSQNDASPGIQIYESDFPGAGEPRTDLAPEDIPSLLMNALELNDFPTVDAGLESMWAFSGDTTKFVFQNNLTDFICTAHQTKEEFPTSFYGSAMDGKSWSVETPLNRVGGENGWLATQVIKTISSDGRLRRWQWELRKHRRPPNLGCWFVESIGSSDRKGQFEPE